MDRLVVIGSSSGGFRVVQTLLGGLPRDLHAAVAIVQHRNALGGDDLAPLLQPRCALQVSDGIDKEPIVPGRVYVAPPDYHLLVDHGFLALSTEAPVSYARPSVDVLFDSAAASYGSAVIAVVVSGSNRDGAEGCARVKARGGRVVVQDPATAEVKEMPQAALALVSADGVLPVEQIAPFLIECCRSPQGQRGGGS